MSKLNSKHFKGKMVESMRKSTENLSGLMEATVETAGGPGIGKPQICSFYLFLGQNKGT